LNGPGDTDGDLKYLYTKIKVLLIKY